MSPRPKRLRKITNPPVVKGFKPVGKERNDADSQPVFLLYEEYEVIRLCDYEMLNHESAAAIMQVSRPTFTRIYAIARRKIAEAFVNGRQIVFEGGKVYFDTDWYRCNTCTCYFNNPFMDKPTTNCPLCGSKNIDNYLDGFEEDPSDKNKKFNVCTCPKCGYEQEHQHEIPCTKLICPECNINLIRKI